MLERLSREAVPEVRSKILEFPLAFDELRPQVSRFVDELCQVDPYHESPILRGFLLLQRHPDRCLDGTRAGEHVPGLRPPRRVRAGSETDQ